jgi:predicted outer membrane protein
MTGGNVMGRNNFSFLSLASLVCGVLLVALAPAAVAQMHPPSSMGGTPNNMNNNNNNEIAPDGMQPTGPRTPENNEQTMLRNAFGNLRRNFDVENDLSKMALKNSSNDDVKKFAQQIISENHSLSNELIVPNPNGEMMGAELIPSQTKKAEKQMKKMTGKPFDQLYLVQMDAYVKNDQHVAQSAQTMTSLPKVSEVGTRVQSVSEDREKQIATLTQETGFKIQ